MSFKWYSCMQMTHQSWSSWESHQMQLSHPFSLWVSMLMVLIGYWSNLALPVIIVEQRVVGSVRGSRHVRNQWARLAVQPHA